VVLLDITVAAMEILGRPKLVCSVTNNHGLLQL